MQDGEIVLLAKGEAIGAIIPTKQTMEPERISYTWYLRTDGNGTFKPQETKSYSSGKIEQADEIKFGPFLLAWSGNTDGAGFLYYEHFPGSPATDQTLLICNTHQHDLTRIDAYDPKWSFKNNPSDPGSPLVRTR